MPSRPKRPCLQPGCPALTDTDRCPAHKRPEPRGNSNSRGYDKRWRRYSEAYRAHNPLCYYCGTQGRVTPVECVDHRIPPSRGGDFWDPNNHAPACKHCNDSKGNRTDAEFLAALARHA